MFCLDHERARASRKGLLKYAAQKQAALFAAHFPETSTSIVLHQGEGCT